MDFFRSAVWKVPFDILHRSRENGLSSYCHTALSFLAPAEKVITLLPEDEVELTIENTIKTISTEIIKQTQDQINMTNPTLSPSVFLYSLGDDDGADSDTVAPSLSSSKDYLRDIACGTGGIWTHVPPGGDLTSAMANYYQRIAASATSAITTIYDDDDTTPVVAWSMTDPSYTVTNHSLTAASGSISADVGGGSHAALTVSAPVYDRAVTPPVLIGVAGITDFIELDASGGDVVGSAHFETLERLLIDVTFKIFAPRLTDTKLRATAPIANPLWVCTLTRIKICLCPSPSFFSSIILRLITLFPFVAKGNSTV
mmetsp:Transcript_64794/g.76717  ORF Transcript_64794/g.76717 Transcript_64794/m.76717 type:complete len:314 (+) Transcript_64794:196-1137(+)